MVNWAKKRPTLSDFWVSSHDRISDFHTSSWQPGDSPVPMLVLRLVSLVFATGILVWSLYDGWGGYWLIFLTNWGLLFVTSMFLFGVIVSLAATCKKIPANEDAVEVPWFVGVYWALNNVCVGVSLIITALYWSLLFDREKMELLGPRAFALDVMTHAVTSLLVVLEVVAARTPIRLLHVYQPLGVGLWFGVFSWIYYISGGTDSIGNPFIYEVLDWRESGQTVVLITLSAVGLVLIYCIMYAVARCRNTLSSKLFRSATAELPFVPADLDPRRFSNQNSLNSNNYV